MCITNGLTMVAPCCYIVCVGLLDRRDANEICIVCDVRHAFADRL